MAIQSQPAPMFIGSQGGSIVT